MQRIPPVVGYFMLKPHRLRDKLPHTHELDGLMRLYSCSYVSLITSHSTAQYSTVQYGVISNAVAFINFLSLLRSQVADACRHAGMHH